MTLLIPLGIAGVEYGWRIIAAILVLLTIVYFSYRQTIAAYPHGGGSYTVATENLGEKPGLLAAAALMIDYILTAAVGISAGVTALTSAVPHLQRHTLLICLTILALLVLVNLRGVKDTGTAFILPTFLFVGVVTMIGYFQLFAEPYVMTGGGPLRATTSLVLFMYEEGFRWWRMGVAAAIAFVLFGIILLWTLLQLRLQRERA